MKNAKVENRKENRKEQPRRAAGVPVRSGVKAGLNKFGGGDRDPRQRMTSPLEEANKFGKLG